MLARSGSRCNAIPKGGRWRSIRLAVQGRTTATDRPFPSAEMAGGSTRRRLFPRRDLGHGWLRRSIDAELRRIGGLKQLEELHVNDVRSTDAGLAHLSRLPRLRKLHLQWAEFHRRWARQSERAYQPPGTGPFRLQRHRGWRRASAGALRPQVLGLTDCKVTDAALVHLKMLTNLKELGLKNCQVTDAGMSNLESMSNLQYLILNGTKITDQGLIRLEETDRSAVSEPLRTHESPTPGSRISRG